MGERNKGAMYTHQHLKAPYINSVRAERSTICFVKLKRLEQLKERNPLSRPKLYGTYSIGRESDRDGEMEI